MTHKRNQNSPQRLAQYIRRREKLTARLAERPIPETTPVLLQRLADCVMGNANEHRDERVSLVMSILSRRISPADFNTLDDLIAHNLPWYPNKERANFCTQIAELKIKYGKGGK